MSETKKNPPKFASKGERVWVLTIKCPDGLVCASAYHSWDAMVKEVKYNWKMIEDKGFVDHPFGKKELDELESQQYLRIGEDEFLLDECEIG